MRNDRTNRWLCFALVAALSTACAHDAPRGSAAAAGPASRPASTATGPVTGEAIDLELADTELLEALAILAGTARVNMFADSDLAGRVTIKVHAVPWQDVLAKLAADHQLRIEKLDVRGVDRPAFWVSKQSSAPAPVTHFSGERIEARFDDTPIRDAAKTLAATAKTRIVVDDGIEASITLHMRLPWDLALYHLAQKYDLRIVRSDRELRISRR